MVGAEQVIQKDEMLFPQRFLREKSLNQPQIEREKMLMKRGVSESCCGVVVRRIKNRGIKRKKLRAICQLKCTRIKKENKDS